MGRKTNYSYEKRQKELKRQKKRDEKLKKKQSRGPAEYDEYGNIIEPTDEDADAETDGEATDEDAPVDEA
jgi:hypothetical protein